MEEWKIGSIVAGCVVATVVVIIILVCLCCKEKLRSQCAAKRRRSQEDVEAQRDAKEDTTTSPEPGAHVNIGASFGSLRGQESKGPVSHNEAVQIWESGSHSSPHLPQSSVGTVMPRKNDTTNKHLQIVDEPVDVDLARQYVSFVNERQERLDKRRRQSQLKLEQQERELKRQQEAEARAKQQQRRQKRQKKKQQQREVYKETIKDNLLYILSNNGDEQQIKTNLRTMFIQIDLHVFLNCRDAMDTFKLFLEVAVIEYNDSNYSRSKRFVNVITGRGNHSENGPVLKPAVESYLLKHDYTQNKYGGFKTFLESFQQDIHRENTIYNWTNPGCVRIDLISKRDE